ncbi:Protein CREG2 [Bienertia sinuspersici]
MNSIMMLPTTTALRSSFLPFSPKLSFLTPPKSAISISSILSPRRSFRLTSMASPSQHSSQTINTVDDVEIFQRIQSHQEKAARLPPMEEIRTVFAHATRGMLSTFSKKYDGYPSGSMIDFACDVDGSPILAVSSLAVHTQDLLVNPKCSLLVAKDPEDRTDLVITLHGDVVSVSQEDKEVVRSAYLAKHPNAFGSTLVIFSF